MTGWCVYLIRKSAKSSGNKKLGQSLVKGLLEQIIQTYIKQAHAAELRLLSDDDDDDE